MKNTAPHYCAFFFNHYFGLMWLPCSKCYGPLVNRKIVTAIPAGCLYRLRNTAPPFLYTLVHVLCFRGPSDQAYCQQEKAASLKTLIHGHCVGLKQIFRLMISTIIGRICTNSMHVVSIWIWGVFSPLFALQKVGLIPKPNDSALY